MRREPALPVGNHPCGGRARGSQVDREAAIDSAIVSGYERVPPEAARSLGRGFRASDPSPPSPGERGRSWSGSNIRRKFSVERVASSAKQAGTSGPHRLILRALQREPSAGSPPRFGSAWKTRPLRLDRGHVEHSRRGRERRRSARGAYEPSEIVRPIPGTRRDLVVELAKRTLVRFSGSVRHYDQEVQSLWRSPAPSAKEPVRYAPTRLSPRIDATRAGDPAAARSAREDRRRCFGHGRIQHHRFRGISLSGQATGGGHVMAMKLNMLPPSVNNMSVRVFVRAAGIPVEEENVWGQTQEEEYLVEVPARADADDRERRAPERRARRELRRDDVPLDDARAVTTSIRPTRRSARWSTPRTSTR